MKDIDEATQTQIEAAVFRRLVGHLQERTDAQNIDIMNVAGFCRNCLSKWFVAAAGDAGVELGLDEVREHVYGMPYGDWKSKYQTGPKLPHPEHAESKGEG